MSATTRPPLSYPALAYPDWALSYPLWVRKARAVALTARGSASPTVSSPRLQQRFLALLFGAPTRSFFANEIMKLSRVGIAAPCNASWKDSYEGDLDIEEGLVRDLIEACQRVLASVEQLPAPR